MLRALWSGATGMAAQQMLIDTVSNNLANVNTTGFKKQRVQFQDLYYQNLSTTQDSHLSVGSGVRPQGTQRDFSQGNLEKTDDLLNVAIEGPGFFVIESSDGETLYTRDGSFRIDGEGQVVTASGDRVLLQGGSQIPSDVEDLGFDEHGVLKGKVNGTTEEFGSLVLATFTNPSGLEALGKNLYRETAASGAAVQTSPGQNGAGSILPGYLETSNVEIVTEMVNLIVAQRAFELNSKSVETADQMWGIANNIKR